MGTEYRTELEISHSGYLVYATKCSKQYDIIPRCVIFPYIPSGYYLLADGDIKESRSWSYSARKTETRPGMYGHGNLRIASRRRKTVRADPLYE